MSDIDRVIRGRQTDKLLAEVDLPAKDCKETIGELLELAGMAPFHRVCDQLHRETSGLAGIEPWRFHALDAATCRRLRARLPLENAGKIPQMLAAADALVMATWLPEPSALEVVSNAEPAFEPTVVNMEHIAATAAAIENLLLAATARGISNYWSSGGVLRSPEMFDLLGIPQREVLLGAVFFFPNPVAGTERLGSKLREHRGSPQR